MSGFDVEAVLRDHERVRDVYSWHCACDKWRDKHDDGTAHRAHVAAVLRVEIERALGDAWDEGEKAGMRNHSAYQNTGKPAYTNPYWTTLAADEGD